jgi:hypothetical protein
VLTLIIAMMLAALGLLMLWSSKHIWRGMHFLFNLVMDKIRSLFARGRKLIQDDKSGKS